MINTQKKNLINTSLNYIDSLMCSYIYIYINKITKIKHIFIKGIFMNLELNNLNYWSTLKVNKIEI